MGLLDRLFGGGGSKLKPVLSAHPELGPVAHTLTAKADVTPARKLFDASRGRWHLRWLVVDAVNKLYIAKLADDRRAQTLDAWVGNTPNEPLAYLARALAGVDAAYRARGRGLASTVSPDSWTTFRHHMAAAAPDLLRAAQLDPSDPTPHLVLMGAAPGLHDEDAVADAIARHHQDVVSRAPDHHIAHRRLVFLMSERLYGSHRESVDLARRLSASAPDGSELPMLLVSAHEYARSYLQFFAKDEAGAKAYTRRLEVGQDIDDAYARSLGSPRHQPGELTPYRRHEAALWFWTTNDMARVKVELQKVGELFDADADPWYVSTDRYRAIRKSVGL